MLGISRSLLPWNTERELKDLESEGLQHDMSRK